jgi:hypothetical protein
MGFMEPSVGRTVHYVSRGSADGKYPSLCRAAVVTEVLTGNLVSLAVLNPSGLFFDQNVRRSEPVDRDDEREPGTWHEPERVG